MPSPLGRRALLRATALTAVVIASGACSSERGELSAPPAGERNDETPVADGRDESISSVAMVGDSITVGATAELEVMFATAGLDVVALDAQEGRRITESSGDVRSGVEAATAISAGAAPDLWVIALGTNDVPQYDATEYGSVISALLTDVPPEAPLVWVDVHVEGARDAAGEFNTVLNELLAARGAAAVAPWSAVASSDGTLRDGVHPSEAGNEEFAAVVGDALAPLIG